MRTPVKQKNKKGTPINFLEPPYWNLAGYQASTEAEAHEFEHPLLDPRVT